jgi:hypothetical protein
MEGGVPEADMSAFRECLSLSWKNPYVLRLAFSAGIGGLLFGYDTGNHFFYSFLILSDFIFLILCFFHSLFLHNNIFYDLMHHFFFPLFFTIITTPPYLIKL